MRSYIPPGPKGKSSKTRIETEVRKDDLGVPMSEREIQQNKD